MALNRAQTDDVLTGLGILHGNRVSAEERLFDELKKTGSTPTPEKVA